MIGGNVVNSFSNNFIKGEMKIKSIKILKTSYFCSVKCSAPSDHPGLFVGENVLFLFG